MDFIEQIFGISPDDGSGSFEITILAAVFIAIVLAYGFYRRRSRGG